MFTVLRVAVFHHAKSPGNGVMIMVSRKNNENDGERDCGNQRGNEPEMS